MCQINVVVEKAGEQENVMESVTALDVVAEGVRLSTFFEEPRTLAGMEIQSIDFLGGKVVLVPRVTEEGE